MAGTWKSPHCKKENHLNQTIIFRFHVNLPGCSAISHRIHGTGIYTKPSWAFGFRVKISEVLNLNFSKTWILESQLSPTTLIIQQMFFLFEILTFVGNFSQRLDLSGKFCDKNTGDMKLKDRHEFSTFCWALFFGWLNLQPNPSKYFGLLRSKNRDERFLYERHSSIQLFEK